mgnify:FL=1
MAKYRIPSDYKNDVSKATHSWSSGVGSPIHLGLAYPTHHRHLNVGDRIRGDVSTLVQSNPMQGPLLNGFRLVTIATFMPDGVIYGWLRNGKRYTPDQYKNFGKYYFNPMRSNLAGTYVDPAFKNTRRIWNLHRGLSAPTEQDATYYDVWADDLMNADTESQWYDHVGRGGLWDWLGVPAGAVSPYFGIQSTQLEDSESFRWNLAPFVTYLLSHYYYIANMQEDYAYFTRGAREIAHDLYEAASMDYSQSLAELPFNKVFDSLDPNMIVDFVQDLFSNSMSGTGGDFFNSYGSSYKPLISMITAGLGAHGGLLSVPYSPDLFGNIIKQGVSPSVDIPITEDVQGKSVVAVPDLRLWTKIQNWMDRLFVSGGRIGDVFRTLWGKDSSPYVNKPDFLGVWQSSINPSNVVASADGTTASTESNVGQMAARVDSYSDYGRNGKIDYYAKEPGTFMLITMLVPQPAYCQGLHPDLYGDSFADDFNPELTGIGFQSVPRHRFSMMPTGFDTPSKSPFVAYQADIKTDPNQISIGEEVAWSWLRTDYRRLHGEFAQNGVFQYWTLVRRFSEYYVSESRPGSPVEYYDYNYYGSYINPLSWQYLFASTSLNDPNFILMADYNLRVVSSVPANYMPFLGR